MRILDVLQSMAKVGTADVEVTSVRSGNSPARWSLLADNTLLVDTRSPYLCPAV